MLKRGWPKGADTTVIGLPKAKKKKDKNNTIKPFSNLTPAEKETTILRSLTGDLAAAKASLGKRTLRSDDLNSLHEIPDSIQDKESLDILSRAEILHQTSVVGSSCLNSEGGGDWMVLCCMYEDNKWWMKIALSVTDAYCGPILTALHWQRKRKKVAGFANPVNLS